MEVDYTEKLNFSDDEENQASKDKRDWWVDSARAVSVLLNFVYVCIHHTRCSNLKYIYIYFFFIQGLDE